MLKLNEKYSINSADGHNYMLINNEALPMTIGYFSTIGGAINWIFKNETRKYLEENEVELNEALVAFKTIEDEVLSWGNKITHIMNRGK